MIILSKLLVCLLVLIADDVAPQHADIAESNTNGTEIIDTPQTRIDGTNLTKHTLQSEDKNKGRNYVPEPNFFVKLYNGIEDSFKKFISNKKVVIVLRNIGTCMVNGVMEIITFFLPAPMIPLLASAAGMIIPFEPVITLREKMPVTSYRRAFNSAVNSFMGTFDKFKVGDSEDPYMTRRFNRRFMNDVGSEEKKERKRYE